MDYKNIKRFQVMDYIFSNLRSEEGLPKEFIGKLFYLSNKLFLLKYGHTITGDKLVAMQRGTTCSETLGIMDKKDEYVHDKRAIDFFKKHYRVEKNPLTNTQYIYSKGNLEHNYDCLSEIETEVLDIIIKRFGNMPEDEISNYTHQFEEWKRFNNCSNGACDIDINEIFSDRTFSNDDKLSDFIGEEQTKIAKMIYNGDFD